MSALPVGDAWQQGNEEDVTEIHDCYCPNCGGGKGQTLLLPTKIPGFREIIIMTLTCSDCGFRNSEVSFGGRIQPQGVIVTLTLVKPEDLNRQVLKSDSTTAKFPHLDLEIPSSTQKGVVTTVEGMLSRVVENLAAQQPDRLRMGDIDNFYRCKTVIDKIQKIIGKATGCDRDTDDENDDEPSQDCNENPFPFQLILDDPAGNASIENLNAPNTDPQLEIKNYDRTPNQDMSLGLQPSQTALHDGAIQDNNPSHKNHMNQVSKKQVSIDAELNLSISDEALAMPTPCSNCHQTAETKFCVFTIPHFKEVIIMSFVCENCGFKSNEIKGGGAIPEFGTKITLTVTNTEDLDREVLKSDTAGIQISELDFELVEGGFGGVYTTVEGLLNKIQERLKEANPFSSGDSVLLQHSNNNNNNNGEETSATNSNHAKFVQFLEKLKNMASGNAFPFTLILSDPLANSFIGPVPKDARDLSLEAEREGSRACYERYVDQGIEIKKFSRSFEQDELLGLNDIKTEGY